jgi:ABC-type branched-subunit amino acid transport system substrate-binding protein
LENNYDSSSPYKLRLAIANLGVKDAAQTTVPLLEERIVAYKNQSSPNDHFLGVAGFPFSTTATAAFLNNKSQFKSSNPLSQNRVLTVSSSASSDDLQKNVDGLYYHIVPLNKLQTADTIDFIVNELHAKHVLIVYTTDPYSETLKSDIAEGLSTQQIPWDILPYQGSSFAQVLKDLGSSNHDLIYFAGYSDDLNALKQDLRQQQKDISIIGGEGLYELGGYTGKNYSHIYFTTFYFHGVPDPEGFTAAYQQTFDPDNEHSGLYGYQLAGPHTTLAYDAVKAYTFEVLNTQAFSGSLADNVQQQMSSNIFMGAAGFTNLKDADTRIDRHMYIVCVDSSGHTQELVDYKPPSPDQNTTLGTVKQIQPITVCT